MKKVILSIVKTAISIPDPLFNAAERVSRRLGISRSRFYAMAIEKVLELDGRRGITQALNAIYSKRSSRLDRKLAKMQSSSIVSKDEQW
jgi:metal-responsive CopG/Arc/MetJ family transcriptional regulator